MRFLAAILLVLLAPLAHAGEPSAADRAALQQLKEVDWPKAYFTQDTKLLDRILGEDFQSIDANGEWSTKPKELEYIRQNKPWYDSLVYKIKRIEVLENGTAIVSGEGTILGKGKDGPATIKYQSSNVLVKRKGSWKAVASHVSGIVKS
ncbi:MAG: nuclear transport factor 2 family protein [Pseudomonadota bacterium]